MAPPPPTLETPRLRLRAHTADDFADYAALWAAPEVVRYIGGEPSSRQTSWARLLRQVGHWQLLGFGYWLAHDKATGRLVGEVGFANFERDIDPPLGAIPEAGWVLSPWAHRQGYAMEAMTAALAWSDATLRTSLVCIIDPDNAPSLRLADRCGFRERHRTTFMGDPTIVLARAAPASSDR